MYVDAAEEEIYSCKSQSKEKDNFVYRCCTIPCFRNKNCVQVKHFTKYNHEISLVDNVHTTVVFCIT